MALSRKTSNHTIPTQLSMQPRRSLVTLALFTVLLKAARGFTGGKYVLPLDPACVSTKISRFAYHHRLSLPPLLYDRQRINSSGLLRLDASG